MSPFLCVWDLTSLGITPWRWVLDWQLVQIKDMSVGQAHRHSRWVVGRSPSIVWNNISTDVEYIFSSSFSVCVVSGDTTVMVFIFMYLINVGTEEFRVKNTILGEVWAGNEYGYFLCWLSVLCVLCFCCPSVPSSHGQCEMPKAGYSYQLCSSLQLEAHCSVFPTDFLRSWKTNWKEKFICRFLPLPSDLSL